MLARVCKNILIRRQHSDVVLFHVIIVSVGSHNLSGRDLDWLRNLPLLWFPLKLAGLQSLSRWVGVTHSKWPPNSESTQVLFSLFKVVV